MPRIYPEGSSDAPWGEVSFRDDRLWYHRYSAGDSYDQKAEYAAVRQKALDDPTFDLFSEWMPTGRPKHDIGRYVASHGVPVPLITSQAAWERACSNGTAMIRSEMEQDYDGYSGLLDSIVSTHRFIMPRTEDGKESDPEFYWDDDFGGEWHRRVEGPLDAHPSFFGRSSAFKDHLKGLAEGTQAAVDRLYGEGLRDGTIDPTEFMRAFVWGEQALRNLESDGVKRLINHWRYASEVRGALTSRWEFIPGVNIKVVRDPVIEGKYYIGGANDYDEWTVNVADGLEDVTAETRHGEWAYTLPTKKIVSLYEKVRTLPYFDNRQAPVMEMQYGVDGKLYFLQYLKNGRTIGDPGAFSLPSGPGTLHIPGVVLGATVPEGEKLRLYLEPETLTPSMCGEAIMPGMFDRGMKIQVASIAARVIVAELVRLNHGHFDSAPILRASVAIGLEQYPYQAGNRPLLELLRRLTPPSRRSGDPEPKTVTYLSTTITSNGREATIESDWQPRTEKIN